MQELHPLLRRPRRLLVRWLLIMFILVTMCESAVTFARTRVYN